MTDLQIVVITRAPQNQGNMATALDIFQVTRDSGFKDDAYDPGEVERLPMNVLFGLRTPVFNVGEILILDAGGREVGYPGRKPTKWDVDYEEVATLEEAAVLSRSAFEKELEKIHSPASEEDK